MNLPARSLKMSQLRRLGITHWSSRLLAGQLRVSHKTVTRAWKAYGIQPWKAESF